MPEPTEPTYRTVLAVYRFVVPAEVTDREIDEVTYNAYVQLEDAVVRSDPDGNTLPDGNEHSVDTAELTCWITVGKGMP